jgi:hypothetical protein
VAVHPETSSSYLGSVRMSQRGQQIQCRHRLTTQYRPVGGQETVLKSLLDVALLERLLFRHDLVQLLASVQGYLVTAVSVVYTEEGESLVGRGGLAVFTCVVEQGGMRVLHADPPALHRGDTEDE